MKIKKGDKVVVITGKDKGTVGTVERAFPREDRVLVSGVNVRTIHERPKRGGQKGSRVQKSLPIHVSNVMPADKAKAPKVAKPAKKAAKK